MAQAESHKGQQHLNLLGIFYILFGMLGLLTLLGLGIMPLFEKALLSLQESAEMSADQIENTKKLLHLLTLGLIALTMVHVFFNILVGICLLRRRCYTACFLAGSLTCLALPLGTVLGIFTIVVLSKKETKQLFDRKSQVITGPPFLLKT